MRDLDVKISAKKTGTAIDWTVDSKKPKESRIDLPKDSGSYEIDFKLDDDTGLGLRFDCSNPIWVGENTGGNCPAPGVNTDQIEVIECDRKELTVIDKNVGPERLLHYQLNFVDRDRNPHVLDPEIKNGGGTIPPIQDKAWDPVLVGVGVAAVVVVIAALFWFR